MSSLSSLTKVNLAVLALLVVHTVDHGLGQPARDLPGSTSLVGLLGFVILATSALLALKRSPLAPEASAAAGATTGAGLVAVHLLPNWWGWVSDPYWDFEASFVSWLSLIVLFGAAVYLTTTGLRYQRYRHVRPYYRH